jgi:hypothetical protein
MRGISGWERGGWSSVIEINYFKKALKRQEYSIWDVNFALHGIRYYIFAGAVHYIEVIARVNDGDGEL